MGLKRANEMVQPEGIGPFGTLVPEGAEQAITPEYRAWLDREEIYFKGDRVRLTGKSDLLHGGLFYQGILTEGHKQGAEVWIAARHVGPAAYRK